MKSFIHNGHIGDVIAFLPTMRYLGGGRLIIVDNCWSGDFKMTGYKFDSLKPLVESQDYVHSCELTNIDTIGDYDVRGFRNHLSGHHSLLEEQAEHLGVPAITDRWINVPPDERCRGRVIVCRSPRYRNYSFPWKEIIHRIGGRSLFIGTDWEHADLKNEVGMNIERLPCKNSLEIAMAIEASGLFIGNQSSPFWIAAGIRKRLIQEVDSTQPNSRVFYNGAHYSFNGNIPYEEFGI